MTETNLREKIKERLDELEEALFAQKHINEPLEFELLLLSVAKFYPALSEEDRDYIQYARVAMEEKMEWTVD